MTISQITLELQDVSICREVQLRASLNDLSVQMNKVEVLLY